MKHKVGDVVDLKTREWFSEHMNKDGYVTFHNGELIISVSEIGRKNLKIESIENNLYSVKIKENSFFLFPEELLADCNIEPDKVSDVPQTIEENSKNIDWEQRRYEMMKDFTAACIANGSCGSSDNDIAGVIYMVKKYVYEIEEQLK